LRLTAHLTPFRSFGSRQPNIHSMATPPPIELAYCHLQPIGRSPPPQIDLFRSGATRGSSISSKVASRNVAETFWPDRSSAPAPAAARPPRVLPLPTCHTSGSSRPRPAIRPAAHAHGLPCVRQLAPAACRTSGSSRPRPTIRLAAGARALPAARQPLQPYCQPTESSPAGPA